jgi:hypothetical protein
MTQIDGTRIVDIDVAYQWVRQPGSQQIVDYTGARECRRVVFNGFLP